MSTKIYALGILASLGIWWGMSFILELDPYNLQAAKFPPHIIYFAASMLSILSCLYFRKYTGNGIAEKCKFIRFLGKNSLCWVATMLLLFLINLAVTVVCGCMLVAFYKVYERVSGKVVAGAKRFLTA